LRFTQPIVRAPLGDVLPFDCVGAPHDGLWVPIAPWVPLTFYLDYANWQGEAWCDECRFNPTNRYDTDQRIFF
jgi:hypothetical protein